MSETFTKKQYQTIYNQLCGENECLIFKFVDAGRMTSLYTEISRSWINGGDEKEIISNAKKLMTLLEFESQDDVDLKGKLKVQGHTASGFELFCAYFMMKEVHHEEEDEDGPTVSDDGTPNGDLVDLFNLVKQAQGGKRNKRRTQKINRNKNKRRNNSRKQHTKVGGMFSRFGLSTSEKLEKIKGWYTNYGHELPEDVCNQGVLNSIIQKCKQKLIDDFNPRGYSEEAGRKVLAEIKSGKRGYYFVKELLDETIDDLDMIDHTDEYDFSARDYKSIPEVNNPFDYYKILPIAGVCADNGGGAR